MLLPWLVRSEMKIKDLCPLEKTEKTAQSCGFLRFSLLTFCASLYSRSGYPCLHCSYSCYDRSSQRHPQSSGRKYYSQVSLYQRHRIHPLYAVRSCRYCIRLRCRHHQEEGKYPRTYGLRYRKRAFLLRRSTSRSILYSVL